MKISLKEKYDSKSKEVSFLVFHCEESFSFKEGQFLMLKTFINNEPIKRAYSIATTEERLKNYNEIGFYVKKASENGMSNFLTKSIKKGDSIDIIGPFGHFVDKHQFKNYLFISTGSGVAPILGIYKNLISEKNYTNIINIFGEKKEEDLIETVQNDILAPETNVKNMFFLSREDKPNYKKGHVQDGIDEAFKLIPKDETNIFICGSPAMVDDSIEKLEQLGIDKEHITFEKY